MKRVFLFIYLFLWAASAGAEEVTIVEHYPGQAKHDTIHVRRELALVDPTRSDKPGMRVNGNMTVSGSFITTDRVTNPVHFKAGSSTSDPDAMAALMISPTKIYFGAPYTYPFEAMDSTLFPGSPTVTVYPYLRAHDIYAAIQDAGKEYYTYMTADGFYGYLGAAESASTAYDPLTQKTIDLEINGSIVDVLPFTPVGGASPDPDPLIGPATRAVNIGYWSGPNDTEPIVDGFQLLVNGKGWVYGAMDVFSSRVGKTDIVPVSPAQRQEILSQLSSTELVHFRYIGDRQQEERLGIIAEDAPADMVSQDRKSMDLMSTVGFITAAVQELRARNEALKMRLEALKELKRSLERS
jgi:hypothetical protein